MEKYEEELVELWRKFSKECFAAGFMTVDTWTVSQFSKWLEPEPEAESKS